MGRERKIDWCPWQPKRSLADSPVSNKREFSIVAEGKTESESKKPNCFEEEYDFIGVASDGNERDEGFELDSSVLSSVSLNTSLMDDESGYGEIFVEDG